MAGIEIAGVVLGSLPLIISALDHYSQGVSAIKSMRKYETVFEYLHASAVTSLYIYRNACEELLSPLPLSNAQLYDLLEDNDAISWQDPILVENVRNRLGSNYLPFKSSAQQINKKISLLARKLRLGNDLRASSFCAFHRSLTYIAQPFWVTQEGTIDTHARDRYFESPLNRIRGGFYTEKYKRLLSSIDDDITRITALISGAIALEPLRLERKREADTAYAGRLRLHAQELYKSLDSRWSSQCLCQSLHRANLRLETTIERKGDCLPTLKFLLSFDQRTRTTRSPPWEYRDVEIESMEHVVKRNPQPLLQRKWDCFSTAPNIDNLCLTLRDPPQSPCLGVVREVHTEHHIHATGFPTVHLPENPLLDVIIRRQSLYVKEKCRLALILASAVLHLHDTPWLGKAWSMNDIYIFCHVAKSPSLLDAQPYIEKSFPSSPCAATTGKRLPIIKNNILFALGVALLEISHGKPLSTFETEDDLQDGNRTPLTDYLIAHRLVEGLSARELPNYANATRRCIHCSFDSSTYDLSDEDFRERFYQGVVVPLQKDFQYVMDNGR